METIALPPPRTPFEAEKREWLRQIDPRSPNQMLDDLAKLRSLEGVTEQSKREALDIAKRNIDFDEDALLNLCRANPAIRSAAFYGWIMDGSLSGLNILFDFDESRLPPNHNMLCVLGELDEECIPIFNRRPDSADYGAIESAIRYDGHDEGVAKNARVFYAD